MIVDCFPFCDELDLLQIRLEELSGVVDRFVLAEARCSFRGKPKPLYFQENTARFEPFLHKIEHLVVEFPETDDGWVREDYQRNALKRALENLPADASVFISDVDEIFRSSAMLEAAARSKFTFIELDLYLYFMNVRPSGLRLIAPLRARSAQWTTFPFPAGKSMGICNTATCRRIRS